MVETGESAILVPEDNGGPAFEQEQERPNADTEAALREQEQLADQLALIAEAQSKEKAAQRDQPRGKWWTGWTADKQKRAASPPATAVPPRPQCAHAVLQLASRPAQQPSAAVRPGATPVLVHPTPEDVSSDKQPVGMGKTSAAFLKSAVGQPSSNTVELSESKPTPEGPVVDGEIHEWQIISPVGIDYRGTASFDDRTPDGAGEDCGKQVTGSSVMGVDGRMYMQRRGTELYLPVTDLKGNVLLSLVSDVPHHGFFNNAMQKAKQLAGSIKDFSDTESVITSSTAPPPAEPESSWPKPSASKPVEEPSQEEEGIPDIQTVQGRKVIRKFITEWRPVQLQLMLRAQHIPVNAGSVEELRPKVLELCDALEDDTSPQPSTARPAVEKANWFAKVKSLVSKEPSEAPVEGAAPEAGLPSDLNDLELKPSSTSAEKLLGKLKGVMGIQPDGAEETPEAPAVSEPPVVVQQEVPGGGDQTRSVLENVWAYRVSEDLGSPIHRQQPMQQPAGQQPMLQQPMQPQAVHQMTMQQPMMQQSIQPMPPQQPMQPQAVHQMTMPMEHQSMQQPMYQQMPMQQQQQMPPSAPNGFSQVQKGADHRTAQAMKNFESKQRAMRRSIDDYNPHERDVRRARYTDTDFPDGTLATGTGDLTGDGPRPRECGRGCMNRCVIS